MGLRCSAGRRQVHSLSDVEPTHTSIQRTESDLVSLRNIALRHTIPNSLIFQHGPFQSFAEGLGPLSDRHMRFVQVLEFHHVKEPLPDQRDSGPDRPPQSQEALPQAFLSTAVFDGSVTRTPVQRLISDTRLRQLCGCGRCVARLTTVLFTGELLVEPQRGLL